MARWLLPFICTYPCSSVAEILLKHAGVSIHGGARKPEIAAFIEDHGLDFVNLIGTPLRVAALGGPFRGTPTYLY